MKITQKQLRKELIKIRHNHNIKLEYMAEQASFESAGQKIMIGQFKLYEDKTRMIAPRVALTYKNALLQRVLQNEGKFTNEELDIMTAEVVEDYRSIIKDNKNER